MQAHPRCKIGARCELVWFVGVVNQLYIACQSPVVCAEEKQFQFQLNDGFLTAVVKSKLVLTFMNSEEFNSPSQGLKV
jgi:hypothetical protein